MELAHIAPGLYLRKGMSSGHQNLMATLLKVCSFIQEGMCLLQREFIGLVVVNNVEMPRKL